MTAGEGSPEETPELLGEVLREQRSAEGGGLLKRLLGLAVLLAAVWLISRNIGWGDQVWLEPPAGGQGATVIVEGTLEGDWRARPAALEVSDPGGLDGVAAGDRVWISEQEVRVADGPVVASAAGGEGLKVELVDLRPGLGTTLRGVRPALLALAVGLLFLASLTVATRWWRLLQVHDCPTPWRSAVRFTYAGLFFNLVLPGFNGGDVARAVAVVRRHPDRRPEALMSVVVDRVLGLVSMVLIGATFILLSDERAADLKVPVTVAAAGLLVGGAVFCSHRVRALLRVEALLGRLPMGERLQRLDRSARLVAARPRELVGALVLSSMNHLLTGAAVTCVALSLGSQLGFGEWMSTTAIANTISGLPISPGGLGVGEHLFGALAALFGSTYAMGVATSLLFRVGLYTLSLAGGVVMLFPEAERAG